MRCTAKSPDKLTRASVLRLSRSGTEPLFEGDSAHQTLVDGSASRRATPEWDTTSAFAPTRVICLASCFDTWRRSSRRARGSWCGTAMCVSVGRDVRSAARGGSSNYYGHVLILFGKGCLDGRYAFDTEGRLRPDWTHWVRLLRVWHCRAAARPHDGRRAPRHHWARDRSHGDFGGPHGDRRTRRRARYDLGLAQ